MFFGGPEYDSSADSTGLSFDGIDDYILVDENVLPDSGDFTISVWLKNDSSNTGNRIVLSQSDTAGSPFYFGFSSTGVSDRKIKMSEDWDKVNNQKFYLDNNWHYYTIVNDGMVGDTVDAGDTSLFYIDGKLVTKAIGKGKSYPKDEKFFIATMWDNSGEYFSGQIDGITIWNRKLSEDEINDLYNSGEGMDPTSDTLAYIGSSDLIAFWPFNEGADSTVSDYSGNGFDGNIIGASWVNIDSKFPQITESESVSDPDQEALSKQKELWGRVIESGGNSLFKARISLKGTHNEEFVWSTNLLTNRRGSYEINDCQPWENLTVSLDGYETQKYLPTDSIFLTMPVDFLLIKKKKSVPKLDKVKIQEMALKAKENYELIQYMINNARPNEVVSIPQGIHTISQPIIVNNKRNITIQSILSTGIVSTDIHSPVFIINNCSNVVFQRLSLGHDPSVKGEHDSEVLRINNGDNIYVNGCEISGNSAIGIKGIGIKSLTIVNCFIHDNSWFAFSFQKCDNVKIEKSRIIENQEVLYKRSSNVDLYSNIIEN